MSRGSEPVAVVGGRGALSPTPRRALVLVLPLLVVSAATPAPAQEIVRRVGRVTFRVDASQAFPGGVVAVRLSSRARLGAAWALLDGRRAPFHLERGVPRALVPVAATAQAGETTLGVGISSRSGEQRVAIPLTISARDYPPRHVHLSEEKRSLLDRPDATRDGRRLLALLRTESKEPTPGLLLPPLGTAGTGFGEPRVHAGAPSVESRTDGLQGERHRGLDYAVPVGTAVRTPAAGTVLFAGHLTLTGETLAIDHGQGVVSVLLHLSRIDVRVGDVVTGGAFVALSGDSGLAPEPLVQWRVYLHGVPVDPNALAALL